MIARPHRHARVVQAHAQPVYAVVRLPVHAGQRKADSKAVHGETTALAARQNPITIPIRSPSRTTNLSSAPPTRAPLTCTNARGYPPNFRRPTGTPQLRKNSPK